MEVLNLKKNFRRFYLRDVPKSFTKVAFIIANNICICSIIYATIGQNNPCFFNLYLFFILSQVFLSNNLGFKSYINLLELCKFHKSKNVSIQNSSNVLKIDFLGCEDTLYVLNVSRMTYLKHQTL